ncbi:branched-chain amino acid ABC transporter permease [Acuticoccus sp. M5D2P5]|uniref:branched-chain amino acid ABC transporter permease n=1 Tax=Acuticoccus kalidii TaxID=2910977 RepID=UPI001F3A6FBD|nr:branched-chain amino acid ABC transporter permease [Acuticoccus kalidii]MCF3932111.1 branched-chain amino acid ABC transporter permease [Acuticoccus kalidii]
MDFALFANLAFNGLIEGAVIALPAVALTLVFGVMGFPNASTGDVMTAGAYAAQTGQIAMAGSIVAGVIVGSVASALLALVFYLCVFRFFQGRPSMYALVASIGLAFATRSTLTFFLGYDQRVFPIPLTRAFSFGPLRIVPSDLYILATSVGAIVLVFLLLYVTPLGRRMRAVADNPDLARSCGISSHRVLSAMWLIAGAVTGLGGILFGIKTVITPLMGWEALLPAFAAMILGGIGNPAGAIAGALTIGIAQELSTPFVGFTYKIGVGFAIMVLALVLRPSGLFNLSARVR